MPFRKHWRALSLLAAVSGCTLTSDVEEGCQGDCDNSRANCNLSCGDDEPCRQFCNVDRNLCYDECGDSDASP